MKYKFFLLVMIVTLLISNCSDDKKYEDTTEDIIINEDSIILDANTNICTKKSDCKNGMYCDKDKNKCFEGECYDNSDCAEEYFCDSARHYCYFVGCSKNEDCKEGICKRNTGKCVGCLVDADCKSGNCNSALGICLMNNCTDDKLEPNDSFSQAYQLNSGIRKLTLCPEDDDYFKITLSYQDKLVIKINTSSIKTISVYLFYEKDLNNPISFTQIKNSGELNLNSAPESGNYFVKVSSTDSLISYEIEVDIKSVISTCIDDIFEENDSESFAKNITSGIYKDLVLCPYDSDFYTLTLNKGDSVEITINGENLNTIFYGTALNPKTINSGEKTIINIENSTNYFLHISSASNKSQTYSLEINIIKNQQCNDDAYEDNDSANQGIEIPLNKEIKLNLCPEDDDWFIIKTYGKPTKITLNSNQKIPFEIYSINDAKEPILYSDEFDSTTQIAEFENLPDTLLIRVISSSISSSYNLKVESSIIDCTDDSFEPNNTLLGAKRIEAGEYQALMLCPADEDYYSISLNKGDHIEIEVRFDNLKADIDIVLFDPLGNEAAYSITSTNIEKITFAANMSGDYILNIFAWDNGSAQYQLNININRIQSCTDDRFEDNDSVNTATKLTSDEIYGLKICPTDYDYYSISLNKGDRLSTGVFYTESQGKLYSALLSSDGKTVFATGENQSGDIVLNITATYSGEYILLVRGIDENVKNDYDILIDIKRDTSCIDDIYEENDSVQYAPAVPAQELTQLILCPQEIDFYKIYLYKGDTILAEVSVTNSNNADYILMLYDPSGRIMDSASGDSKNKSVISEITSSGYYYIYIKNNSTNSFNYKLSLIVDGIGGKAGDETITLYPFDRIDKNNPALYELKFLRTPSNATVENLVVSLIVEHKSIGELLIQAQYADASEITLWDGYGDITDKGFDDDSEDDADIELYNRSITNSKGKNAQDSLLMMIEDISNTNGTVYIIEGRLFWKIK